MQPSSPPRVNYAIAVAQGVRFYSRLRVPRLPGEADPFAPPDGERMARTLPLAACVIVAPAILTLWGALRLDLPPFVTATVAIAILVLTTGAFHEDGLADTADGFGGGATRERRLEIMKDSRIGTFGGAALALGLLLRIGALSHLLQSRAGAAVLTIVIAAAMLSRVAGLVPLALLPSARSDGAGVAVGRPSGQTLAIAYGVSALLMIGLARIGGWSLPLVLGMLSVAMLIALAMTALSRRMIMGQTGDVAGATQQIVEAACYILPLMIFFRP